MAEVLNLSGLRTKLLLKYKQAARDADVVGLVGYTAAYAIWVHEMPNNDSFGTPRPSGLGVYWGPRGQPKFLEEPARRLANDGTLGNIVARAAKSGKSVKEAILLACLRIQRESQMVVPVEYGNLRASAFTRIESAEAQAVAAVTGGGE